MKTIAIILAALGLASAGVIPVPVAPLVGHVATQYHAQDELGQYAYGYAGGPSAKDEIKTADGVTRGGYTYIDGNGLVQTTQYVSDPINGFRVAATNLPAGPAVPAAPQSIIVPSAPIVPIAAVENQATIVQTVPANPEPSTIVQAAVTQLEVHQPAPVEEKAEDKAIAADSETAAAAASSVQSGVEVPNLQVAQLFTPVQDTPEVQAAKAAHLATVEQVKIRDAAQEVHDAQENHVTASEEPEEQSEEGEEPTEASDEGTEAPAAAAAQPAEPAPNAEQVASAQPVPETPVKAAIVPSVVATELTPAQGPVAVPAAAPPTAFQLVPSVLTREVVAAVPAAPVVAAAPVAVAPAIVAAPNVVSAPVVGTPSGPVALEHVGQITSQYHAQDELGQYTYGYSGGPSAKHEVKTVDGQTSGGYSYIDSHGLVQTAAYVSDPVNGFRVAATNIPQQRAPEYIPDSPEVEDAKQKLFQAQAEHVAKL